MKATFKNIYLPQRIAIAGSILTYADVYLSAADDW